MLYRYRGLILFGLLIGLSFFGEIVMRVSFPI